MPIPYNISQNPVPVGISGTPTGATQRQAYSWSPTVTGGFGVRIFSMTGTLPERMTFNPFTGTIAGIPRHVISVSGLSITVTDASGSATLSNLTIPVASAISNLMITGTPAAATVGTAFTFTPTVTGGAGPRTFSFSGRLEDGLRFNPVDGSISGTPTEDGGSFFIITVQDSVDTATLSGSIVASYPGGGVVPIILPNFAFEAESQAVFDSMTAKGATLTYQRKYSMNQFVRKLKSAGIWTSAIQLAIYHTGVAAQDTTNWRNPGTYDPTFVGSPAFYSVGGTNSGVNSYLGTASAYIDLKVPMSVIPRDNHAMYTWLGTTTTGSNNDIGAIDASSNGFAINGGGAGTATFRSSGPSFTSTDTNYWTSSGMYGFARSGSTTTNKTRNVSRVGTADATASVDLTGSPLTLHALGMNNNGTHLAPVRRGSASFVFNRALTPAEEMVLHDAYRTMWMSITYGEFETYDPGFAPQANTYDVVVYGATAAGFAHAVEAKARGLSVAIVGSWRERSTTGLGGMSAAGGLGAVDWDNNSAMGGLAYDWINGATIASGNTWASGNNAGVGRPQMRCDVFLRQLRAAMDVSRGGSSVPIFLSTGLASVGKSGTKITSFTTKDGRTFNARYFHDATYSVELAVAAGLSYSITREAANGVVPALANPANDLEKVNGGYRGPSATQPAAVIDPYVTPGNSASGFIFGVDAAPPNLSVGDADPNTCQAMNFRVTMTKNPYNGRAINAEVPANYNAANYELVARGFSSGEITVFDSNAGAAKGVFALNDLGGNTFDFNNANFASLDYYNNRASKRYYDAILAKDYTTAEAVVQEHVDWTLGLIYWLGYSGDSRIPTGAVRDQMRLYYYPCDHYYDKQGETSASRLTTYLPHTLYEREGAHLASDVKLNANDIGELYGDGTTPRISTNTAAVASYTMDHHFYRRFLDPVSGGVKNEGGLRVSGTGPNNYTPLPLEIALPKVTECTNMSVSFSASVTSLGFGATRMEATAIILAQSTADLTFVQASNSDAPLQSFNPSTYRAAATAPVKGTTVPPFLPQAN